MKFLTEKVRANYSINKVSEFINIKKYILDDLDLIDSYYKTREGIVNNKNIFVRLIKQTIPDMEKSIYEILDLVSIDYKYKAKFLGLTSEINQGKVFTNLIGETTILLEHSFLNPFDAYNDLNLNVCKILFTDYTDLSMNHLTKVKKNNFIIMIDLQAMIAQYKKWSEDRIYEGYSNPVQIFVYQIVYTNMIKDLVDWSILNRFFNPLVEDSIPKHPFGVRNYDKQINDMVSKLNSKFRNTNSYYEEILKNIPSLVYEDMYEKLRFDKFLVNAQNYWVYFIFISYILTKLINLLGNEGYKKNNGIIIDLKFILRDIKHNKYLDKIDYKTIELSNLVYKLFDETTLLVGEIK